MLTAPDLATASQTSERTLADVVSQLDRDRALDDRRRLAWGGAIRTVCSILGRRPDTVPAALPDIDRQLNAIPRITHGRSTKTIANVRARLRSALLYCSGAPKLPPHGTPLAPKWTALYERLNDPRLRHGLSRFVRIASYRGIAPTDVNDAVLEDVARDAAHVNWGRDALPFWRRTATLWNEAAAGIDGWPQIMLTAPAIAERIPHLQLAAFPASLNNDINAYLAWSSGSDLFVANPPSRPLKASTLRLRREQLRIAASTLARMLGGPDKVTNLATLVEPDNVRQILRPYTTEDRTQPQSAFVRGLAMTLLGVARHWVKSSFANLAKLAEFNRQLGKTPSGLTAKNLDLLRRFEDPKLVRALVDLPRVLLAQVHAGQLSRAQRLQKIRTALAIQLLLTAPMRLANLATLRLNEQVQWPADRGGPVFIIIRADESKNGAPLEYELRGPCRDLLYEYLDHYRVHFAHSGNQWLFIDTDGTPVNKGTLRDGISKATRRALGFAVSPHQFRHLAAAFMLDARPGAIGLVRDLLGHKDIKTTLNFYAGMRTRQAALEYDKILAGIRGNDTGD